MSASLIVGLLIDFGMVVLPALALIRDIKHKEGTTGYRTFTRWMLSLTLILGMTNLVFQGQEKRSLGETLEAIKADTGLNVDLMPKYNGVEVSDGKTLTADGDTRWRNLAFSIQNNGKTTAESVQLAIRIPKAIGSIAIANGWKMGGTQDLLWNSIPSNELVFVSDPISVNAKTEVSLSPLTVTVPDDVISTNRIHLSLKSRNSLGERLSAMLVVPKTVYIKEEFSLEDTARILSGAKPDTNYEIYMELIHKPVDGTISVRHNIASEIGERWKLVHTNIIITQCGRDYESLNSKAEPIIVQYTPDRSYLGPLSEIQTWNNTRVEIYIQSNRVAFSDVLKLTRRSDGLETPPR